MPTERRRFLILAHRSGTDVTSVLRRKLASVLKEMPREGAASVTRRWMHCRGGLDVDVAIRCHHRDDEDGTDPRALFRDALERPIATAAEMRILVAGMKAIATSLDTGSAHASVSTPTPWSHAGVHVSDDFHQRGIPCRDGGLAGIAGTGIADLLPDVVVVTSHSTRLTIQALVRGTAPSIRMDPIEIMRAITALSMTMQPIDRRDADHARIAAA